MKFLFGIITTTVLIVSGLIYLDSKPTEAKVYSRENLLRESTTVLGSRDTKVYLVEFSDFQCPACKLYKATVDELVKKYPNELVFGYRHFPLPQHEFAEKAAYAVEAAGNQGKFWEMYSYLFDNQTSMSDETIERGVEELGIDNEQFKSDINSSEIKEKVQEDKRDAIMFGVNSTPTFYLNGIKLNPKGPNDLRAIVEREILGND